MAEFRIKEDTKIEVYIDDFKEYFEGYLKYNMLVNGLLNNAKLSSTRGKYFIYNSEEVLQIVAPYAVDSRIKQLMELENA